MGCKFKLGKVSLDEFELEDVSGLIVWVGEQRFASGVKGGEGLLCEYDSLKAQDLHRER